MDDHERDEESEDHRFVQRGVTGCGDESDKREDRGEYGGSDPSPVDLLAFLAGSVRLPSPEPEQNHGDPKQQVTGTGGVLDDQRHYRERGVLDKDSGQLCFRGSAPLRQMVQQQDRVVHGHGGQEPEVELKVAPKGNIVSAVTPRPRQDSKGKCRASVIDRESQVDFAKSAGHGTAIV